MWTIDLSSSYSWCMGCTRINPKHTTGNIAYIGVRSDPSDYFWELLCDEDNNISDENNIEIVREIIKRKIPFKLQYHISTTEHKHLTSKALDYNTYIDYTIVVNEPKHALMCKLTWG
jgi:hypothetical protein